MVKSLLNSILRFPRWRVRIVKPAGILAIQTIYYTKIVPRTFQVCLMVSLNITEGIATNNKGQQVPVYYHNRFNTRNFIWSIIGPGR